MSKFFNATGTDFIGGSLLHELISPGESSSSIKSIILTNVHAAGTAVGLFIQDDPESGTTNTYYLVYSVDIPVGSSLLLDEPSMFKFDDSYGLYLRINADDKIDVVINT
tara:strand:- start:1658 stop:1984 length:327 start_codon:yes stop_codon:yes gene_type:complete